MLSTCCWGPSQQLVSLLAGEGGQGAEAEVGPEVPWDHEATLTATSGKWGHASLWTQWLQVPVGSGGTEWAPGNVMGPHLRPLTGVPQLKR